MRRLADRYVASVWARAVAVAALLVGVVVSVVLTPPASAPTPYRIDFDVYRLGGQVFLDGGGLYGDLPALAQGAYLPFTYPPIAAVLFAPLAWMPLWPSSMLFTLGSIACLIVVLRIVLGRLVTRPSKQVWWLVVPAATVCLCLEPVRDTLNAGQVNLALMALVFIDAVAGRGRWWRGLLIGLAISVKLTPAVFLLLLVLRRDWRAVFAAVGAAVLATALGWLALPDDSITYWTGTLGNTDRIGTPTFANNQSLRGMLIRLGLESSTLWLGFAVIVGVLIAVVAWRLVAFGAHVAATLAVAFVALFCSPISWDHHWVWVAPLLVAMVVWGSRPAASSAWHWLAGAGLVIFLVAPHQRLPNRDDVELTWVWWQHLVGASYLLWGLAALVTLGALATQTIEARSAPVDSSLFSRIS